MPTDWFAEWVITALVRAAFIDARCFDTRHTVCVLFWFLCFCLIPIACRQTGLGRDSSEVRGPGQQEEKAR